MLICEFPLYRGFFFKMGFPPTLMTDEVVLDVLGNFEWYHWEVAFPLLPLPSDYEGLCPDFDLAVAKEYALDYDLPEIPRWCSLQCLFMTL